MNYKTLCTAANCIHDKYMDAKYARLRETSFSDTLDEHYIMRRTKLRNARKVFVDLIHGVNDPS